MKSSRTSSTEMPLCYCQEARNVVFSLMQNRQFPWLRAAAPVGKMPLVDRAGETDARASGAGCRRTEGSPRRGHSQHSAMVSTAWRSIATESRPSTRGGLRLLREHAREGRDQIRIEGREQGGSRPSCFWHVQPSAPAPHRSVATTLWPYRKLAPTSRQGKSLHGKRGVYLLVPANPPPHHAGIPATG